MRHRWFWLIPLLALVPAMTGADPPGDKPAKGDDKPKAEKPATPDDEYTALMKEIQDLQAKTRKAYQKAESDKDKQKVVADFQATLKGFAGRFVAFAEKNSKNEHAIEALELVLQIAPRGPQADKAVDLVLKDHATSDEAVQLAQGLAQAGSPVAEKLVRALLPKHTAAKTKAGLNLSLALVLQAKSGQTGVKPAEAKRLEAEAEDLLDKLAKAKEPDLKTVAQQAKEQLYVLRHLSVGKVAVNVKGEDADGKKFALNDYRGKVVLLDFWASW